MSNAVFAGDTSGSITIQAPAVAGTNTLTLPTATGTLAINSTFAFKNRLINAGFIINQRGYTSGTSLSAGSYGHDRWKSGASGGTYTFTQGSAGVPITITITAGTIQQVIEGCNVPEGGTYTLSWTGTATARINSGSYSTSPITVTSQTAGANMTIEFATGTVSYPQLEVGSSTTSFDYRDFGRELYMCQRYYETSGSGTNFGSNLCIAQDAYRASCAAAFVVPKRASPTVSVYSSSGINTVVAPGQASVSITSISFTIYGIQFMDSSAGFTNAKGYVFYYIASAEL